MVPRTNFTETEALLLATEVEDEDTSDLDVYLRESFTPAELRLLANAADRLSLRAWAIHEEKRAE